MLTQLEPLKRHQDAKLPRSKNTGTWLLKLESFNKWQDISSIEGNGRVFCCYGMPGAGKTVIRYGSRYSIVFNEITNIYYNRNLCEGTNYLSRGDG